MKTLPLTEARKDLSKIVDEVSSVHEHVVITKKGRPEAVLISAQEFESWQETLEIMERLWAFKHGDPELSFSVGNFSGRIKRRVTPAPYSKPYPTLVRVATREAR